MKISFFFILTLFLSLSLKSQTEDVFSVLKSQLQDWDPIRGEWLSNSFVSISKGDAIPDRMFPEEFTPYEVLTMVPIEKRRAMLSTIQASNNSGNKTGLNLSAIEMIINHSFCEYLTGRSYGDPHLISFDKASYSFQTVGEFVLTKSSRGHFEIQTRQKPQNESFSLNTAVAMNVGGDRLCYYGEDKPDSKNVPFRLNGQPIQLQGRTYFLPHGGTIRLEGRNYIISWPTGEIIILDSRMSGKMQLANITVKIFKCDTGEFEGLLGNANNDINDDFNIRNSNVFRPAYASFSTFGNSTLARGSEFAEKEYLAFLAKDFAEDWRVNDLNTLFDYEIGRSTSTFTDRSFPRVHMTLNDLDLGRQANARIQCEQMGVSLEEILGCIFDNGFLNIIPNPIPNPSNPVIGRIIHDVRKPALNTNDKNFGEGGVLSSKPRELNPDGTIKDFDPIKENNQEGNEGYQNKPSNTEPINKPYINQDSDYNNPNSSKPIQIEKPTNNSKPVFSSPVNKPSSTSSKPTVKPSNPISEPIKPIKGNVKPGKG